MNYRHAYHAGSLDDVVKHLVEIELILALQKKNTPFFFLDTHAGAGLYDLHGKEAQKNNKREDGIFAVMAIAEQNDWPPSFQSYVKLIEAVNTGHQEAIPFPRFYPGSAWIAALLLRPHDRFAVCEYHPEEFAQLKKNLSRLPHHMVHHRDGLEAMGALLPPKEQRALVFIDPPYEQQTEVASIYTAINRALHKFPHGVYALWYPIKINHPVEKLIAGLFELPINGLHQVTYQNGGDDNHQRLLGSGMIVINPPWEYQNKIQNTINCLNNFLKLQDTCRISCSLLQ